MRQPVLATLSGNRPPAIGQVQLRPGRPVNFAASLGCQESNSEQRGDQGTLAIERLPDESDLIFAQYPLPLLLITGRLDHVARIRLQPLALNRGVEHLAHERQRAVRQDGCAGGNLVQQLADILPLDVLDPTIPPPCDQRDVGFLAGLLLVR